MKKRWRFGSVARKQNERYKQWKDLDQNKERRRSNKENITETRKEVDG